MPKTQKHPIGNEFKANIVQENLLELFQYAHDHAYRTEEPTIKDGNVGDIVLVDLDGLTYLYAKYPDPLNWQRAQMIESTGGYDDLRIPGSSARTGASAPDLIAFAGSSTLRIDSFHGTGTAIQEVHFSAQMPHSWKEGSVVYPHIHWTPVSAAAGNVKWGLEYTVANVNETLPATTTLTVVTPTAGVAWRHQVSGFGAIDMTGKKLSAMFHCRLFRDPADAQDTYTDYASFLEFDFHFLQDAIGSSQQFVK